MMPNCELCGGPMPEGEEMFNYHGYSGPCPKPLLQKKATDQRIRLAYETYRAGFKTGRGPVPDWDVAPDWVRDVITVAYLQGSLDGAEKGSLAKRDADGALCALFGEFGWATGHGDTLVDLIDELGANIRECRSRERDVT